MKARWLPRVRVLDLAALGIDLLAEIAVAGHQRDEHHRQIEIGAGARHVAGENPETAAIGVDLGPDRDLHREIGNIDPARERLQMLHRFPC